LILQVKNKAMAFFKPAKAGKNSNFKHKSIKRICVC
jgi:hypothetical protein